MDFIVELFSGFLRRSTQMEVFWCFQSQHTSTAADPRKFFSSWSVLHSFQLLKRNYSSCFDLDQVSRSSSVEVFHACSAQEDAIKTKKRVIRPFNQSPKISLNLNYKFQSSTHHAYLPRPLFDFLHLRGSQQLPSKQHFVSAFSNYF